ncbi:MAG: hypothetical protein AAB783_01055 [Patescibacteria group bacterium]
MRSHNKKNTLDKKRLLREQGHVTRPPRLEGVVKENMMQPVRKKKKVKSKDS